MIAQSSPTSISGDAQVAGTPPIAAPGALYAVGFCTLSRTQSFSRPSGLETALRGGSLTKTEEEETIIINRPDRSTYPHEESVQTGGATPPGSRRSARPKVLWVSYTVISGVFYIGLGDEFDESKLTAGSKAGSPDEREDLRHCPRPECLAAALCRGSLHPRLGEQSRLNPNEEFWIDFGQQPITHERQ
jgi:hypothetical protein